MCVCLRGARALVRIPFSLRARAAAAARQVEQWFHAYVELLYQLRLWACAARFVRLVSPAISASLRQVYQLSSHFSLSCGACARPLADESSDGARLCKRCAKPAAFCAICRLPVTGMFIWCKQCGHGGHPDHIAKWFETHAGCPAGCAHTCNPASLLTDRARAGSGRSVSSTSSFPSHTAASTRGVSGRELRAVNL
jgi:hypothetical protein